MLTSVGLYGQLVLSIAVVLRLINCICSCLIPKSFYEVSKIMCTSTGRGEEKKTWREERINGKFEKQNLGITTLVRGTKPYTMKMAISFLLRLNQNEQLWRKPQWPIIF